MTAEQFEELVEAFLQWQRKVLLFKARGYARETDRLENFRIGAQRTGLSPEKFLQTLVTKHDIKLDKMIGAIDTEEEFTDLQEWQEVLVDRSNYNLLLWALVNERYNALNCDFSQDDFEKWLGKLYRKSDYNEEDYPGSGC